METSDLMVDEGFTYTGKVVISSLPRGGSSIDAAKAIGLPTNPGHIVDYMGIGRENSPPAYGSYFHNFRTAQRRRNLPLLQTKRMLRCS